MNSVILFTLIGLTAIYSGCKRDKCDYQTGDITICNFHNDPYNLFVDEVFNTKMAPWDTINLVMHYGQYNFKLVQVSGYDSVPAIFEESLAIDGCSSIAWDP